MGDPGCSRCPRSPATPGPPPGTLPPPSCLPTASSLPCSPRPTTRSPPATAPASPPTAVELDFYCSSSDGGDSPLREQGQDLDATDARSKKTTTTQGPPCASDALHRQEFRARSDGRTAAHTLRSVIVKPASYKAALVGDTARRPKFLKIPRTVGFEWRKVEEEKKQKGPVHDRLGRKISIHERLGPRASIHDRLGSRVAPASNYSELLKTKAAGRCFNCFARDHRIAQCRDPPRCVLCSRSGHKARRCPGSTARRGDRGHQAGAGQRQAAARAPEEAKMSFPELPPGQACNRPGRIIACANRIGALVDAERDLEMRSLIAVPTDAAAHLTCDIVRRDALRQLRIPEYAMAVEWNTPSTFLLNFDSPELRTAVLARNILKVGRSTGLRLMPWTRQANATLVTLPFRARVCFEGVPGHARQIETLLHLLPSSAFIEKIDLNIEKEQEVGCTTAWIWCVAPDALPKEATLKIAEPIPVSIEYLEHLGNMGSPMERPGPASMLQYNVLIHLDRVLDYSPLPASPSDASYESDTSGLPDESLEDEWPVKHVFPWRRGEVDGTVHEPARRSVHARLGGRDRSPPRGGGGGAGGYLGYPPPNNYDMSRFQASGSGSGGGGGGGGSSSRSGRPWYLGGRRRAETAVGGSHTASGAQIGDSKTEAEFGGGGRATFLGQQETDFLFRETQAAPNSEWDPMSDEAAALGGRPGTDMMSSDGPMAVLDRANVCSEELPALFCGVGMPVQVLSGGEYDTLSTDAANGSHRPSEAVPFAPSTEITMPEPGVNACATTTEFAAQTTEVIVQESGGRNSSSAAIQDESLGMLVVTPRYTKPARTPVLATPKNRLGSQVGIKLESRKKMKIQSVQRKSERIASRPRTDKTIEEQATALLMKKCGLPTEEPKMDEHSAARFREQFVEAVSPKIVADLSDAFGIMNSGAEHPSAIAIHAEA